VTTYHSKYTTVEAKQWNGNQLQPSRDGASAEQIVAWVKENGGEAVYHPQGDGIDASLGGPVIGVRTINGWAYAKLGHYVVPGEAWFEPRPHATFKLRDFYPCDPETFEKRWEEDR
jgi:hypothetical protein